MTIAKVAPWPVKLVAYLFVLEGVLSAMAFFGELLAGNHLNGNYIIGALNASIGYGLLEFRPAWRIVALIVLGIKIAALGIWLALLFVYQSTVVFRLGDQLVKTFPLWVGAAVGIIIMLIRIWQFYILVKPDILVLFGGKRTWEKPLS